MSTLPGHFIADLRHPIAYPDLDAGQWFQWCSVPMIGLSALATYQFVKSLLPHAAQRIVEVGCGNGYLCLELARDGHEVLGIDVSPDICQRRRKFGSSWFLVNHKRPLSHLLQSSRSSTV